MDIIKAGEFLKAKLEESKYYAENPDELKYRIEHSYRVMYIGMEIASAERMNVELMSLACLLHDIGYCTAFETQDDFRNHGRYGAKVVRPFLESIGLSAGEVREICYGIAIHVDDRADFEGEHTPFAVTICDADNIDRFDVYRIYERLNSDRFQTLTVDERIDKIKNRLVDLERLKGIKFATPTAQRMWTGKLEFQHDFYGRLLEQLKNSH